MSVSQNDPGVKYFAIVLFEVILFGVFFAGYDAGQLQRWWMGLLILIMFPVLDKFFSEENHSTKFGDFVKSLDDFFDNSVKIGVVILFMAATALVFYSGYFAGQAGWWWASAWLLVVIPLILKYYTG